MTKKCKYCKGIIENAKPNQFYHKKDENEECYTNRMRDLWSKSKKNSRKGRIDKRCAFCGEIIKNATHGQLYHKQEENEECFHNRTCDNGQERMEKYRKNWKMDLELDKKVGTGWLGPHPEFTVEGDDINFELECKKIKDEKHRLKIH